MADSVFNIAKGKVAEYVKRVDTDDPTNAVLVQVLLTTTGLDSHAVMKDYDTLNDVITNNTEATFTNYARRVLTQADVAQVATDDTNDRQDAAISDWVIANAGGATNNTLGMLIIAYDSDSTVGTDANIVPLTMHDLTVTTDGTQLTIAASDAGDAFFRAS